MSKKSDLVRGFGLAMSIGAVMDEIRREFGVTEEIFHILATPEGRPHLERMIAGLKPSVEVPVPIVYLRRLFENESIIFDATDGTKTIAQATDVFTGHINPDFVEWGLDVPSTPTAAMAAAVNEQICDGNFVQILGSVGYPKVVPDMVQHQIVDFCAKYKDKLRQQGHGTFFPFQVGGKRFVANVYVHDDGCLSVHVDPFSAAGVWYVRGQHRFVVLQLVPSAN